MKKNGASVLKNLICLSAVVVFGIGCSSGGSSDSPVEMSGNFIDSAVEGLDYETPTKSGITDVDGFFEYQQGESITFSIGDLVLGECKGQEILTPIEIVYGASDENDPVVTNICRFLQSLDVDGDLENGIFISPEIRQEINGRNINFDMDSFEFDLDPDVIALFETLNAMGLFSDGVERGLRPAAIAQSHMRVSLSNKLAEGSEVELLGDDAYSVPDPKGLITKREWPEAKESMKDTLVAGNNIAAVDLYHHIIEGSENLIFSPYAISRTMAMTVAGACGRTKDKILEAMSFNLNLQELPPAFNALDLSVRSHDSSQSFPAENQTFRSSAGAWAQIGYYLPMTYFNTMAHHYGAPFQGLDFYAQHWTADRKIEDWISAQTIGNISSATPSISDRVRFVFANTVLLTGGWQTPFDRDLTTTRNFELSSKYYVGVPMMTRSGTFSYAVANGYEALELPFKDSNLSMLILMPDSGSFDTFESALDPGVIEAAADLLAPTEMTLTLPRFAFNTQEDLEETLYALGIDDAWDEGVANFSGINDMDDLYVSGSRFEGIISVAEPGATGAGAMVVNMEGNEEIPDVLLNDWGDFSMGVICMRGPEYLFGEVAVSRPFIFVIRDIDSGAILFLGRVMDPS